MSLTVKASVRLWTDVPPGLSLSEKDIQPQLDRRRPGQSRLATDRDEADRVTILSGVENSRVLGTPIALSVANKDQRPGDYAAMRSIPRPSHADYTYQAKYGIRTMSGGGRSSARETIGRVAAGAIAEKFLFADYGIEIVAWVTSVGTITAANIDETAISRGQVDQTLVRCPSKIEAEEMIREITAAKEANDSLGGIISCVCRNVPAGLGEPVFDKMEARLAHAMLSIPATKGFEIGSGFLGSRMTGSTHNDPFVKKEIGWGRRQITAAAYKAASQTVSRFCFGWRLNRLRPSAKPNPRWISNGNDVILEAKGRHDPCVVPRAVPIVETMAALVIADLALQQRARGFERNGNAEGRIGNLEWKIKES